MPEGHEVDTDRLHEAIEQETENGGRFLKGIALSTALLAAFAAIAALKAWATANEAMIIRAEATRLQAHASDQNRWFSLWKCGRSICLRGGHGEAFREA